MNGPNGGKVNIPVPLLGGAKPPRPTLTHIFVRMLDGTERQYLATAFGLDPAGDLLILMNNVPVVAIGASCWSEARLGDIQPITEISPTSPTDEVGAPV